MRRFILWAPFAVFVLFVMIVAWRLGNPDNGSGESRLVGRPLPALALPPAVPDRPGIAPGAKGPRLVNVFASWCVPCAVEAPQLMALRQAGVAIDGIAIRDKPADIRRFLDRNGDPFARIGADANSAVQLALGSSGVPESFVVDARGIIRRHHIGEIRPEDMPVILAALRDAR